MADFKNIPSQFDEIPEGHPVVFISYSWDSEEHKAWVKKLSDDLRSKYAVYTLLDRYNRGGFDLITFMTKAVERADRVLLIGTPDYSRNRKIMTVAVLNMKTNSFPYSCIIRWALRSLSRC